MRTRHRRTQLHNRSLSAANIPRRHDQLEWFGLVWLIVSVVGFYLAMRYDFIPGRLGVQRVHWPIETHLPRHAGLISVVAFVHPRCPCTRATVNQLVRTMQRYPQAELIVPVFVPRETAELRAWQNADYVRTVRANISRAQIVFDRGGEEAQRFGAFTSGTILVYDRDGTELFRGGITDRRGGEGDNLGLRTLGRILAGQTGGATAQSHPVFGCPLVLSDHQQGGIDGWRSTTHSL